MEKLLKNSIYTILCATILLGTTQSNSMNKWSKFKTYFIEKSKLGTSNFLKEQKESLRLDDQYKGICFKPCVIQKYFKRNNTKKYNQTKVKKYQAEVKYHQAEVKYHQAEEKKYQDEVKCCQNEVKYFQDKKKYDQHKLKYCKDYVKHYQNKAKYYQNKLKDSQGSVKYYQDKVKYNQNKAKYYQNELKYYQNELNEIIKMNFVSYDQRKYFEI